MKKITIITPSYNRKKELKKLYTSLLNQTKYDFEWLIIDDGSTDNTEEYIKSLETKKFNIKYVYKKNGGKHTALNLAFTLLKTELMLIVDSDDFLTDTAVEQIVSDWNKYRNNDKICGLVYKKKYVNGTPVSDTFKEYEFEENYNSYVINQEIKGDKAEVFRSKIIQKYKFPEYPGEKFVGEGVLWSKIARNYNMIFINEAIYMCDYLEGGLTKSGRKMRINNPCGGMFHAEEYTDKIYKFKIRLKNAILYDVYYKFAKKKKINQIKPLNNKMLRLGAYIPSLIIYHYWKNKYQ